MKSMLTSGCTYKLGRSKFCQYVRSLAKLINERWNHAPDVNLRMIGECLNQIDIR